MKNFGVFLKDNRAEPIDFNFIKRDKEFLTMLRVNRVLYNKTQQVYFGTLPELLKFIEGIKNEVK